MKSVLKKSTPATSFKVKNLTRAWCVSSTPSFFLIYTSLSPALWPWVPWFFSGLLAKGSDRGSARRAVVAAAAVVCIVRFPCAPSLPQSYPHLHIVERCRGLLPISLCTISPFSSTALWWWAFYVEVRCVWWGRRGARAPYKH